MRQNIENNKDKNKGYKILLNDKQYEFEQPSVTGLEILNKAGLTPVECYTLYMKLAGCDFEKIGLKESVDIANPGVERFVTKEPDVFHYTLDEEPETTEQREMTANEILKAGGIDPATHYLVEINPDGSQSSYKGKGNDTITMRCHPRRKFISVLNGPTPVS